MATDHQAGAVVDEEVTFEDLLAPLRDAPNLGDVRRQLQKVAEREAMPEPGDDVKRTREVRSVQYQSTSRSMKKWIPQLKEIDRADQVMLGVEPEATPQAMVDMVGTFEAEDDFEKELERVTKDAGTTEKDIKAHGQLPMNPRIRDEEQNKQVARLRALIMREKISNKRVSKIKSKTYRKIHRNSERKEREMLLERLEHENPELAKTLRQEYEKKHAEMRLMRQRNARKKWAATMQRFAKNDKNMHQEISRQAQNQRDEEVALRRAIKGKDPNEGDESDVDFSADEDDEEEMTGTAAQRTVEKAKKLTLGEVRNLETGLEDLPTSGVLGMNFMRQAIKKKREDAKGEAQTVLKELEQLGNTLDDANFSDKGSEDEENADAAAKGDASAEADADQGGGDPADDNDPGGGGKKKKKRAGAVRKFSAEELAEARAQVEAMLENDHTAPSISVAGPVSVKGVAAQDVRLASDAGGAAPSREKAGKKRRAAAKSQKHKAPKEEVQAALKAWDMMGDPGAEATDGGGEEEPSQEALAGRASGSAGVKRKRGKRAGQEHAAQDDQREEEEEGAEEAKVATKSKSRGATGSKSSGRHDPFEDAEEQRELVRSAFIEGTQEEDFQAELDEKEKTAEEKALKASEGLAGWGSWTGDGIRPRKPRQAKKQGTEEEEAKRRQKRSRFMVYQGKGAENAKYFVEKVPHEFKKADYFNQQLQMPTGPEWQTLPNHINRIKPKFFAKVGAIVPPLQYVKEFEPDKQREIMNIWASSKQPKRMKAKL